MLVKPCKDRTLQPGGNQHRGAWDGWTGRQCLFVSGRVPSAPRPQSLCWDDAGASHHTVILNLGALVYLPVPTQMLEDNGLAAAVRDGLRPEMGAGLVPCADLASAC